MSQNLRGDPVLSASLMVQYLNSIVEDNLQTHAENEGTPAVTSKTWATFFLSDLGLNRPHMVKPRVLAVRRTDSFPYSPATYKKLHNLRDMRS
jgi:hypothetical protein